MKGFSIPTDLTLRLAFYADIIKSCLASRDKRLETYALARRYYLYGSGQEGVVSPWNKIYSHIDQLTSMLYASDSTRFVTGLESGAPKEDRKKLHAFNKRVEEVWHNANTDSIFEQAVRWALVYNTMFVKFIRSSGEMHPWLVDPGSMGVYREDVPMIDRQEAFVHVYYITISDLRRRISLHPNRDTILATVEATQDRRDIATEMPAIIDRILMANFYPLSAPSMIGEANIPLGGTLEEYRATVDVPLIEMRELWIYDDDLADYRTVTFAGEQQVIYDRENLCMQRTKEFPGEHGFVQITPSPQYDYFWGISAVGRLMLLQERRNKRMDDIQIQLEKAIYPPLGVTGTGAMEDKLSALMDPKGIANFGDPTTKLEQIDVKIPQDAYKDIQDLDAMFDEISGLTNVMQGRGEAGVRSSGHASRLANLGSSRPKKRALVIEDCLEKAANITGRHVFVDDDEGLVDDDGRAFLAAQMTTKFRVKIDAHSNSPIFAEDQKLDAQLLLKAKAITRKRFVEMIAPPMMEELIYDLENEILPEEKAAAQQRHALEMAKIQGQQPQKGAGAVIPMKGAS
jgi:hypothetical protein